MRKSIKLVVCALLILVVISSISFANSNTDNKVVQLTDLKKIKVASVQFNPQLNDRNKNIKELAKVVTEAAENGAKLIVTPEMATTGYYYENRKAIESYVDTIPGYTTDIFEQIAKKYHTYIVIGMAEVDKKTDIYYNAAALVGPYGYIGKYRKTHQWETEEHWAAWGDLGVPVFDTEVGKIAINICMDSAYFEPSRLAAINGANILAFPTNSSAQAVSALQARAMQNGLYIISSNRSNTENGFHMIGASAVWSPDGEKLVESKYVPDEEHDIDEPTIIYATIDKNNFNNKAKKYLIGRRTDIYKDLMLHISPWNYTKNSTSHDVVACALQYKPQIGDINTNFNRIHELVKHAVKKVENKEKSLDLIVLPELSVTGVINEPKTAKELAEKIDGNIVSRFKKLAQTEKIHIVFSMIEKDHNNLYNTAILVNSDGKIVGKHRKTHLSFAEKAWAKTGNDIKAYSTNIGKIGLMIGEEAVYPEIAGVLAVNRADIIAIPSSWNGEYGNTIKINSDISENKYPKNSMCIWDSVALSAQAYTIVSNYTGTQYNYLGSSSLYTLDPLYGLDQPVVASKNKEVALVFEFSTIQSDWWFNQEKLISSRRTYLYKPLVH